MTLRMESFIGNILLIGLVYVTVFVTPWHNLEPVSKPKLATLSLVVGLAGICYLLLAKFPSELPIVFFSSSMAAIICAFLNLLVNHQFLSERIFGVHGRNFGAITLVSLILLSFMFAHISASVNPLHIIFAIKSSSLLVAAYFLIQLLGIDRADWIDAYGGVPSSTLGNPNFVSAFVAIGFVSTLPLLVIKRTSFRLRSSIFFVSIFEFYVIVESSSFQGLAIVIIGFALIMFRSLLRLFVKHDFKIRRLVASSALLVFIFMAAFTILRYRGSLSIENSTLKARLDYWHAGLAMGLDSPIFGKGFDFFGESYFRFRSESAAIRSPNLFTDSAHNYFIDLFAFGGFPLLVATTLPMLLVFLGMIKFFISPRTVTNQNQLVESIHSCLFIVWIGFIFQALLSPFSIPLAYLGFLLTGYLYGKFTCTDDLREGFVPLTKRQVFPNTAYRRFKVNTIILRILLFPFFILLPILGIQPMIADAKFRDGIEQGNGDVIYRGALSQPKSFQTMSYAAEIFLQNKREDLARPMIVDMVKQNPDSIVGWRLFERVSESEEEIAQAHAKILALDPKNPELKKK